MKQDQISKMLVRLHSEIGHTLYQIKKLNIELANPLEVVLYFELQMTIRQLIGGKNGY